MQSDPSDIICIYLNYLLKYDFLFCEHLFCTKRNIPIYTEGIKKKSHAHNLPCAVSMLYQLNQGQLNFLSCEGAPWMKGKISSMIYNQVPLSLIHWMTGMIENFQVALVMSWLPLMLTEHLSDAISL